MAVDDVYMGVAHSIYQQNANVFCVYFQVESEIDESAIAQEIADWVELVAVVALQPLRATLVEWRCSTARRIWPDTSIETVNPFGPFALGTRVGTDYLPGQLSAVIQLVGNSDTPTSRNRGRDFHYGMLQSDIDTFGANWTAAFQQELNDIYVAFTSTFTTTTSNVLRLGVFSRTQAEENVDPQYVSNGGTVPDPPTFGDPFFNILDQVRSNPLIRTQRRRQPEDPCRFYTTDNVPA